MKCNLIKWDAFGNYEVLEFLQCKEVCEVTKTRYEREHKKENNAYYVLEIVENVREF